jgi:1-acyl-sn-glycerol-3-phosphate acyltransferase
VWLSYILIGSVRALLGATPRWIGSKPEDRQRIYFANHTSHIDTVALWSALPPDLRAKTRTAAAADYWGSSALKRTIALQALNAVLIDRKRADPEADPLRPLYDVLEAGQSIIIFPEGTRGPERLPRSFQVGSLPFGAALSRRRAYSGLSRQPASQHAEGDFLSGAADLHGALWRAAPAHRRRR